MKAYGHNNKFANITGFSAAGTENVYSFVYHHGPAIESELVAYRIYFNEKQTVDPYSKVNKKTGNKKRLVSTLPKRNVPTATEMMRYVFTIVVV